MGIRNLRSHQTIMRLASAGLLCTLALAGAAVAVVPKEEGGGLAALEFFLPELQISSSNVPLEDALPELPNRGAWEDLLAAQEAAPGGPLHAFIDPRSGTATNLLGAFPLIPGKGVGNRLTLGDLASRLGYEVREVNRQPVADALLAFVRQHQRVFAIELQQLGEAKAEPVSPELWQVSIPQTYQGIPVRHGRFLATINNGNLVLAGSETWGNVTDLSPVASINAERALELGFGYVVGRLSFDEIVRPPALEVIPVAPPEHQAGEGFVGPLGEGYRHRLAWTFAFVRSPEIGTWEVMVDAHSGEMLAFQDLNHYADQRIWGGAYPLTNTGVCPAPYTTLTCGVMQLETPMPFSDTGLVAPNNFADSAGVFNWTSGTTTTTLSGRYVKITDHCGTISNSSTTGYINLGGSNNQHDCQSGGGSPGNTAAARTAFYHLNGIHQQGRGWLPGNSWLQGQTGAQVNRSDGSCNALWNGAVWAYRSGNGCRNTGEIAGVLIHEWGHGLDYNDANGSFSNTSEAYADIAALYSLQTSCLSYGFYWTNNRGCGQTSDGTGYNANEAGTGPSHCDLNCSGVRDADWDKHANHTPDTPANFVCGSCGAGMGPCARNVHCSAAPPRQAAWDLVARDLTASPFNLNSHSAFVVGNRLFYVGSGNIGSWYTCTCPSTSGGCGSTNAYMQWLAADDDNGNLNDGTPHITAIRAAFSRHNIACSTPTAGNSGCAGGPTTPPTLTTTAGNSQITLSWNSVGASRYWVFRSDGENCFYGHSMARIADVRGTSFIDTQVANEVPYSYYVVAQGSSAACFTRVSNCVAEKPSG